MMMNRKRRSVRRLLQLAVIGTGVGLCQFHAADVVVADTQWTGAVDNDFLKAGNWTAGVPASLDDLAFIEGGANLPAVIGAGDETIQIGAIRMGIDSDGGAIIQNGKTLVINGEGLGEESAIGVGAPTSSSWIMNNNATILYDDPIAPGGSGFDTAGSDKDFDIGRVLPEGATGSLEMHDDSILRISDDLKISDGGGFASVSIDGNSQITVGSGVSVGGTSQLSIKGSAVFVTGNSAGPGDSDNGRTNEGYLTLSTGDAETADVLVAENGKLYARTLQQRGGVSTVQVRDNGEFAIFDVFEFAAPDLGTATIAGSAQGPQRTSHVAANTGSEMYIELFDQAKMSVDSDLEDSGWSGLAMSGGDNRGANGNGGMTLISIHDSATFQVQQDLNMTLGVSESAESFLRVEGPDATVFIGGDLRMALDPSDVENPGTATIEAILSGSTQSTIQVGGTAMISNGNLAVSFNGYTPVGGESYLLISANAIEGTAFRDMQLPNLDNGLSWNVQISGQQVLLSISSPADFNGNGVLDAGDIDLLTSQVRAGNNPAGFDLNGDSLVNEADRTVWVNDLKRTYYGDSNLDGEFNSSDLVTVFQAGKYEDGVASNSTWATGDWNGDGDFDSSDFVTAFSAGGYEAGLRPAVSAVPEPGSLFMMLLGLLGLTSLRKQVGK